MIPCHNSADLSTYACHNESNTHSLHINPSHPHLRGAEAGEGRLNHSAEAIINTLDATLYSRGHYQICRHGRHPLKGHWQPGGRDGVSTAYHGVGNQVKTRVASLAVRLSEIPHIKMGMHHRNGNQIAL